MNERRGLAPRRGQPRRRSVKPRPTPKPPAAAAENSVPAEEADLLGRIRGYSRRFDRRWLVFVPALVIVVLAFLYARIAVTLPSPERVIAGAQGLEILDRNGNLIFSFGDEPGSGRIVPLEEISPYVIDATIATEDAEFWQNPGVNPKGLARAAYENLAFWEKGGFFKGSGGSSITQQLAKNLYIKPEDRAKRSPLRKLNETLMAFELSRRYSKESILEWYLSNLYYGNGAYGIESASFRYFNKPPSDLTLSEAALLAGLPRSPNYYEPIGNHEAALARQEQVLSLMVRHGFLTAEAKEEALAQPFTLNEGRVPGQREAGDDALAPHFAVYVRDLLPVLLGKDKVEGNLVVTTTLDLDLQEKAVQAVTRQLDALGGQNVTNGALVSIDPATGEVLAMVGSYDFFDDDISGQVNNATSLNQPGSTMKPVTYLATFMEEGWNPSTPILDEPIPWGDTGERLGNADGRYRGQVNVRTALGSSLNVPAVKALDTVGLETVYQLAQRMGITTLRELDNYGRSFTLGGAEVTLLDMTYVFSVLANYGEQRGMSSVLGLPEGSRPLDPIAVLKVETSDGEVLWEAKARRSARITPADKTYQIIDILSDDSARASMFGRNSPLNLPRPAAVKSGSSDETRDAWTIGFTPQLVTGVWVGNANNAPIPNGTSTYTAAPIWRSFMLAALDGKPALPFNPVGQERQPTPRPVEPSPTPQQEPTREPEATNTTEPTRVPEATNTPRSTNTPQPTNTQRPTQTPRPEVTTGPPGQQNTPRGGNNDDDD
jgi:membrane peptidoglycan carboxypeptidase